MSDARTLRAEARERRAKARELRAEAERHDAAADALDLRADGCEHARGDDPLVGAREAGIPRDTWRRLCREARIEGARLVGREWRAPRSAVRAWLDRLPTERPTVARARAADDASGGNEIDRLLDRAMKRSA